MVGYLQRGSTMVEILVSVVVIAIGLLGIAALQGNSIGFNHSAHLRSIATSQASNMADRMRANPDGRDSGAYNTISGIPSNPSCTTCTPTEMAVKDTYQWNSINATLLPSGQGTVVRNGTRYTITIRWDGNRTGATGTNCSGNTNVDLSCFILEVQL